MWNQLKEWVRQWLGVRTSDERSPDGFVQAYEEKDMERITAIIANKLAMLTFSDSTLTVADRCPGAPGARTALIRHALERLWCDDAIWTTAQMLGKGGKLLVPTVLDGSISIGIADQNRMIIREMRGRDIVAATLLADSAKDGDRRFFLLADYELADGAQCIRYRAVSGSGADAGLDAVEAWSGLTPEIAIDGTDRLLFAFLRCPRDNRRNEKRYGVPITYGAEAEIAELNEHIGIYRREYRLTRPMLGLDSSLWRDGFAASPRGLDIHALRRTVQDSDDPFVPFPASSLDGNSVWQYFAPDIRYEAMEQRYQSLCRRVEKACGLSQGVLTERQALNYANKDEVRAAQYDTFSAIHAIRDQWEHAIGDLAYAIDVLAEHFELTPAGARGQYELSFDWDTSLIESTAETFQQNLELHGVGGLSTPELRQWVRGGSLEEAQAAVEKIRLAEDS